MSTSKTKYAEGIMMLLTDDYFRDINPSKITIKITDGDDYYMQTRIALGLPGTLYIGKECFKMDESAFTGVMAHELAHITQRSKILSLVQTLFFMDVTKVERAADMEVINRGLGKQLYAFHKYHDKIYKKYKKSDGLTKKEIIALLKVRNEI